jgi:methyl-accepting chemotaxis protein
VVFICQKVGGVMFHTNEIQNNDDILSAYYRSITNALMESHGLYTTMINELNNMLNHSTDTITPKYPISLTKKALINAKQIEYFMKEAVTSFTLLTHKTNEISRAISLIQDIADQTTLLALNILVETARDENSNNLTIVAEKVQRLTESTERATKEIETVIR